MRLGTLFLSFLIAIVLWGMAHGTTSKDRGFDIPVVFDGVPDTLVLTERSASFLNIRVLGNAAALRNVDPTRLEYRIDVSEAQPGPAVHEVDATLIDLPRGARILSRSPARVDFTFEQRGRKSVRVTPTLDGEVADGHELVAVDVEPRSVWLTGARREVLRLSEVTTETIQMDGLSAPLEREVRLAMGSNEHIWPEGEGSVTVRVEIAPTPPPAPPEGELPAEAGVETQSDEEGGQTAPGEA